MQSEQVRELKTTEDQSSIPFRKSLRGRLFYLALATAVIAALMLSAIAVNLGFTISRQAEDTSSQSLRQQAEDYLAQINATIANQNDLILDRAARDVRTAAEVASALYASDFPTGTLSLEEQLQEGDDGQYLNGPEDVSSLFVPNTTSLTKAIIHDIELSNILNLTLQPVFENNPNAAAIYFGSINDLTSYYPNIELGKLVPPDFQVTQRPWFAACLENNPDATKPKAVWSPVYLDATGLGLVTTVAFPVYQPDGEIAGVVGLDLTLTEISKNIQSTSLFQSGYSFLIDQEGKSIILPEQGYADLFNRAPETDEFATDLLGTTTPFANVVQKMVGGESGFQTLTAGERELFVAYSPLTSTGWSLASVVPAEEVFESITTLRKDLSRTTQEIMFSRVLPVSLLIALVLLGLGVLWSNRLVIPIRNLAEAASQIGAGKLDVEVPVSGEDEIGLLGRTFSAMQARLSRSFQDLEERVAERTQQLERRSLQLQTAAEVARDITNLQSLDELLWHAVDVINERFDFYNVGIFLVDETGEEAILKAASGDVGRKLTEQGIELRVGEEGIVGYVTRYGHARVAANVRIDPAFKEHPSLPETHSEVTLPLRIGNRIIGALDVQSKEVSAFDPQDVSVLQTLADQLAIAIENARLVGQLRNALKETETFYQEQAATAWEQLDLPGGFKAYEYDRIEIKPASKLNMQFYEEPASQGNQLLIPIKLRQQVIGYIGVESDDAEHEWTEDEIAIAQATANQAALTLENARLLAETQRRATLEEFTSEVSMNIRQTLDMETIMRTAVEEIQRALGSSEVMISLAKPQAKEKDNGNEA